MKKRLDPFPTTGSAPPGPRVTVADVARVAQVHRNTVSLALRP